jgi:uncharacterized cupin superfamily protein
LSYQLLSAEEAFWRPSNQMGVLNTDLAKQLGAPSLGARLWRLRPGQASTRHRHRQTHELYLLLEGTGRIRVGDALHTVEPLSSVLVDPDEVRQLFNDTDADQLWLVVGAPPVRVQGVGGRFARSGVVRARRRVVRARVGRDGRWSRRG